MILFHLKLRHKLSLLTMLTSVLAHEPALRPYAARHPAFKSVRGSVRFQRAVRP